MNFSERLISWFEKYYYTAPLLIIVEIVALILGIAYVKKDKTGFLFILYISFDICLFLIFIYWGFFADNRKSASVFVLYTNPVTSFIELSVYYYFFIGVISNKRIIQMMKVSGFIYGLAILVFLITKIAFLSLRFSYISYLLGAIEFLLLLPPCFAFFYELINTRSDIKLLDRPSFWIASGIFLFCLLSIPYYLINRYIVSSKTEMRFILTAMFFYLPFTINFLFLIKAFSCKKKLTI